MASLYEQLMASKGAPKAAAATNSTQLRKAPVSLRSAMRKYAEGGDVNSFSGEEGRSNQSLSFPQLSDPAQEMARAMQTGRTSDYAKLMQDMQQPMRSQETRLPPSEVMEARRPPSEVMEARRPPPEIMETKRPEPRYEEPRRPEEPRYEEPRRPEIYPQDYAGPRTSNTSQTQQVGPRTSYRQEADGTMTEIGYDGQPISGYTPEQMAMHNATMGIGQPEYRYVWNGQGYDKLPNGPQIGYGPEENVPPPPREDPREEPRFYEPEMPMPETRYEPEMPMPETRYEPEMPMPEIYPQYPEEPVDYTKDPGILQPQEPVYNPSSKRGGDLAKLIADMLARNGGGGSLEEQRRLMELLGSIRG